MAVQRYRNTVSRTDKSASWATRLSSTMIETVYFVTGASRGINLEFVSQLTKRSNSIVYIDVRNPSSLQKVFPSLLSNLHIIQCDVISNDSISAATKYLSKLLERVNILINNTGTDNSLVLRDTEVSSFRSVLDTNLVGVHRVTRAFLPLI